MARPSRNFNSIREAIVEDYRKCRSAHIVSRKYSMAPAKVCEICREAGIEIVRRQGARHLVREAISPEACLYCRHFSKTSITDGYCLQHRRAVHGKATEHCFTK